MLEMISSIMRLSAAMTMFGLEQAQNAMLAPADTRAALARLRETLDAMSDTLAAKIDEPKREALEGMSRAQTEMFDRTAGVVSFDAAGEFVRKTSESLSGVIARPSSRDTAGAA